MQGETKTPHLCVRSLKRGTCLPAFISVEKSEAAVSSPGGAGYMLFLSSKLNLTSLDLAAST